MRMHLDLPLILGLVLLSGLGLVVLYSAAGENSQLVFRQGTRMAFAFALMFLVAQVSPQLLFRWAPWLYFAGLGLLVAVLVFGDVSQGARRWLSIGPGPLSALGARQAHGADDGGLLRDGSTSARRAPGGCSSPAGAVVVPVLLVVWQPDLGNGHCSLRAPESSCSSSPVSAGATSADAESWWRRRLP